MKLIVWLFICVVATQASLTYLDEVTNEDLLDSSEDGSSPGVKNTTCKCGWANKVTSRIVNGAESVPHEFPFVAGLVYLDLNHRFCGAVIITVNHILSAAHCTFGLNTEEIGVLVGDHNITDGLKWPTEIIPVEEKLEHENYVHEQFKFDISLLILEKPVTFSQLVGPVCLPTHQLHLEGQYLKIIGWGATKWQGSSSKVLRKADVRVIPLNECRQVYKEVDQVTPTQICTFRRMKGICQGDSGGPLVWLDSDTNMYTLAGIISFGMVCGDKNPSVYTDVGAYLDWINQHIKNSKTGNVCKKA